MTVKRRDFQKVAAQIHEFLLKLSEEVECAELRDALNLTLLQMQRYYRSIRNRSQIIDQSSILSRSLRGLSPMTPFKDAPDKFVWKWIDLENARSVGVTLPARLDKEESVIPSVIRAAKQGDNNLLLQLLERDPHSVSAQDSHGRSALLYAVQFSCLDTLQNLLEQGADVNSTANDGSTAVHIACHNGNHEALQILMQYNAELSIQDIHGRAPIHWACTTQSKDCLQILIDQRVDVGVRDDDGMSPSMWACRMDHIEHFDLLSSVQCQQQNEKSGEEDGFERDKAGRTWLHWSVRRTEPLECLKTLLTEHSAALCDHDGKSVMHSAAELGSLPSVKAIIETVGKQGLEQRDHFNRTPLILATMGGHGEVVNYLLSEGADLACVDNLGATAWDYAIAKQLHYCLLILASYIRQRSNEKQSKVRQSFKTSLDGDLGINQLQINGEGVEGTTYLHNSGPRPPPTKPPVTPRTPRTPRRNGFLVSRPQEENQSLVQRNSGIDTTSKTPVPSHRWSSGPPQKRSPSAPMEEEELEEDEKIERNTSSSKRMKSENRNLRDSVSSGNSPSSQSSHHSPHHHQYHSSSNNNSYHVINSENNHTSNGIGYPEEEEDGDQSVSIDLMDVSDSEKEEKQKKEPPSPRPPAPGMPRTPRANKSRSQNRVDDDSPQIPPSVVIEKHQPPANDRQTKLTTQKKHYAQDTIQRTRDNNYDGDWEEENEKQEMAINRPSSSRPPLPQQSSPQHSIDMKTTTTNPTPYHLSPIAHMTPPTTTTTTKKKKKKKNNDNNTALQLFQPKSYTAQIEAPFPASNAPLPSTRRDRSASPYAKSQSEDGDDGYYDRSITTGHKRGGDETKTKVDIWQRPEECSDEELPSYIPSTRSNVSKPGQRSGSSTGRGQKYPVNVLPQTVSPSGEINRISFQSQQQMAPRPINPATKHRLKHVDDQQRLPPSPIRTPSPQNINSTSDARWGQKSPPRKNELPPATQPRVQKKNNRTTYNRII